MSLKEVKSGLYIDNSLEIIYNPKKSTAPTPVYNLLFEREPDGLQQAIASQEFIDMPGEGYDTYSATCFENETAWTVWRFVGHTRHSVGWPVLSLVDSFVFQVYEDDSGVPNGDPEQHTSSNLPVWEEEFLLTDPRVTIEQTTEYSRSITLNLTTAVELPIGKYWFCHYAKASFGDYGQYFIPKSTHEVVVEARMINPGLAFGGDGTWQTVNDFTSLPATEFALSIYGDS